MLVVVVSADALVPGPYRGRELLGELGSLLAERVHDPLPLLVLRAATALGVDVDQVGGCVVGGLVRDRLVGLGFVGEGRWLGPLRLFVGSGVRVRRPGRLWLTSMVDRPVGEVVRYADRVVAVGEAVGLLERGFGLRDFEGRSFPGWHHHMTLVSAAFACSRLMGAADGCGASALAGGWAREDGLERSVDLLSA
ncbi:hypothetical protein BJP40_15595 [Streptomyces sp. CC53]|nr:hypothetical protein BJP40_15595 [Streptomyces sp. CC53]